MAYAADGANYHTCVSLQLACKALDQERADCHVRMKNALEVLPVHTALYKLSFIIIIIIKTNEVKNQKFTK